MQIRFRRKSVCGSWKRHRTGKLADQSWTPPQDAAIPSWHLVGLHDGCCSVKCIEVCCLLCKDCIFVSINKLLQVLWNRNNEKSSELRWEHAVKVSELHTFKCFTAILQASGSHLLHQIPGHCKKKWCDACSNWAASRRFFRMQRCQDCNGLCRSCLYEQPQIRCWVEFESIRYAFVVPVHYQGCWQFSNRKTMHSHAQRQQIGNFFSQISHQIHLLIH